MRMKKVLFFTFVFFFFCPPQVGITQTINKDSISFVHSYGMIDEDNPVSIILANELYRISVNAKTEKYPTFYGGSYIENDSIVFLLSNTASFADIMTIATDISLSYLRLKACCFSYAELLKVERFLSDFYFKSSNRKIIVDTIGWSSWYLSALDNKILVRLNECTDKKIRYFKKYILDSPMILFVEADKKIHI